MSQHDDDLHTLRLRVAALEDESERRRDRTARLGAGLTWFCIGVVLGLIRELARARP